MPEKRFWMGSKPKCDINSEHDLLTAEGQGFSDAKILGAGWAMLCPRCASRYGVEYGTGKGQRYELAPDGRWVKVEG